MMLGKYYLAVNKKHRRRIGLVTPEREIELKRSISDLGEIIGGGFPWILTGSLAVALNVKRFYRDCNDVDIILNRKDLSQMINSAGSRGYRLCHRLASLKVSSQKNLYVYQEIDENGALKQNYKHLKLIRRDSLGNLVDNEGILDSIDLFPYEQIDEENVMVDGEVLFPEERLSVHTETPRGQKVLIASPDYLMKFKEQYIEKRRRSAPPKHALDLKVLKEFVTQRNS
ncbi:Uncharacterised protein [uncultured archaeon]|nr:Uncharacterised protein [uncultured archaeon]